MFRFASRRFALASRCSSPSSSAAAAFTTTLMAGFPQSYLGAEAEESEFAATAQHKHHTQKFMPSDPIFMTQFTYSSGVVKQHMDAIRTKNKNKKSSSSSNSEYSVDESATKLPVGERECAKMLAKLSGTLKCYYKCTTGQFDGVMVYTFPKNHDVHCFEQIIKSSGNVRDMYTTKLMTSDDAKKALTAAKELVESFPHCVI